MVLLMPRTRLWIAVSAVVVYLGSVVLANWLTTRYGFVSVGFGVAATAGTFAAGGALVVRDVVQDAIGRVGVFALIVIGALLSFLVAAAAIATASAAAFAVSETLDMLAYSPLRTRGRFGDWWWRSAVTVGGLLGAVADTVIFLSLAFGLAAVPAALPGQLLGKGEVVAGLLILGMVLRRPGRRVLDAPCPAAVA